MARRGWGCRRCSAWRDLRSSRWSRGFSRFRARSRSPSRPRRPRPGPPPRLRAAPPMKRRSPRRGRGGWRTEIEVGEPIQPIKGMNDVLPEEVGTWQYFEACTRELLAAYGYEEIRVPIVEHTELFKRAIGEHTDVVGKEMYTFTDRGGESLTLRPEATAGI